MTGVTLYLFAREQIPLETTGFLVLIALVLGFYFFEYPGVEPQDFLLGFGNGSLSRFRSRSGRCDFTIFLVPVTTLVTQPSQCIETLMQRM